MIKSYLFLLGLGSNKRLWSIPIITALNILNILLDFLAIYLLYKFFYTLDRASDSPTFLPHEIDKFLVSNIVYIIAFRLIYFSVLKSFENRFWYKLQHHISSELIKLNLEENPAENGSNSSSNLQILTSDSQSLVTYFFIPIQTVLIETITIIIFLIILIRIDPLILLFVLLLSIIVGAYVLLSSSINKQLGENRRRLDKKRIKGIIEFLNGYIDIKQFGSIDKEHKNITRMDNEISMLNYRQVTLAEFTRPIIETSTILLLILIISSINNSNIQVLNLIFVLGLILKLLPSLSRINNAINLVGYGKSGRSIILNKLSKPKTKEVDNYKIIKTSSEKRVVLSTKGLSKSYGSNHIKFKDLIFLKGKLYLVRGNSGVGKSTFLKILSGLIKPSQGTIILHVNQISYVGQEIFLREATIEDNIKFGEEYSESAINEALKKAGFKDYISIKDHIKENGKNFSGGQRQRLAIARALIRKSDIIIIDESITGLEEEIQKEILDSLKNLCRKGVTVIVSIHSTKFDYLFDEIIQFKES